MSSSRLLLTFFALLPHLASVAPAQVFSQVTEAELALTEVVGHPGAPAVVLFKRAELRLRDSWTGTTSILDVQVRTKILTEGGKAFGQVSIGHGAGLQLERFAGRTILPDGRIVPLEQDAVFRQNQSRARQRSITKAAFPAVEVGAIVDYRYRLRWSSVFLEPWTMDERVPVLLSELVYHRPFGMTVEHHLRGSSGFQTQSDDTSRGAVVRIWAEDLPPVLEEPYGLPFADLAHQVTIVPQKETRSDGSVVDLLDSWSTVCGRMEETYDPLRRKARQVKKKAMQLIAAAGREKDARVQALHAFVRDEIELTESGIRTSAESLDAMLGAGRGTYAEKALLLQAMLKAAKISSRLVWAVDWREGFADLAVVNPGWFEKVLVLADMGDQQLFLDPGEPVAAGALAPTVEGTDALIVDAAGPEVIRLPTAKAEWSRRRARLELAVDEEGRLRGHGQLTLTGHHAWFYLGFAESAEATNAAWMQWLAGRFEGYDLSRVVARRWIDEQKIEVEWDLSLAEELVLGDEVSLPLSRPLGPLRQRYTIPPENRRSTVHLSFADRDELELTLIWPKGWRVDIVPEAALLDIAQGRVVATTEVDTEQRSLVYHRSLEISRTRYEPGEAYAKLRQLYSLMEGHDAQSLVLFRQ